MASIAKLPPRNMKRMGSRQISAPSTTAEKLSLQPLPAESASPPVLPFAPKSIRGKLGPSGPISLSILAERYNNCLPQKVTVVDGSVRTGTSEQTTSGIYEVHFVEFCEAVDLGVSPQHMFQVPYHSTIKFSLLYPKGTCVFCGVRSVLAADPVPKVICTETVYVAVGDEERLSSELSEGEILAIGEQRVTLEGYDFVEVYSFSTRRKKLLSVNDDTSFTTNESNIGLRICDLLDYVKDIFPSRVKMSDDKTQELFEEVYTLYSRNVATKLICTREQSEMIIELPASPGVMVTILQQTENFMKALIEKSERLVRTSDKTALPYSNQFKTKDGTQEGAARDPSLPLHYDYALERRELAAIEASHSVKVSSVKTNRSAVATDFAVLMISELRNIRQAIEQLSQKLKHHSFSECIVSSKTQCHNRRQLQSLNTSQVIELMRKLGFPQLEDLIMSKSIDGHVLSELDEATLEHEFGISSKIDRVKVMLIISGQKSAIAQIQTIV